MCAVNNEVKACVSSIKTRRHLQILEGKNETEVKKMKQGKCAIDEVKEIVFSETINPNPHRSRN